MNPTHTYCTLSRPMAGQDANDRSETDLGSVRPRNPGSPAHSMRSSKRPTDLQYIVMPIGAKRMLIQADTSTGVASQSVELPLCAAGDYKILHDDVTGLSYVCSESLNYSQWAPRLALILNMFTISEPERCLTKASVKPCYIEKLLYKLSAMICWRMLRCPTTPKRPA